MKMISFVIPMFNEEKNIGRLIDSVKRHAGHLEHEIITVDNGSKDKSVEVATQGGAKVFVRPKIRIGAMRNVGAAAAKGDVLVFLDADVFLKEPWGRNFPRTLELLKGNELIITGSWPCISDENPSWIEKYWVKPFISRNTTNFLSSAHFLMPKSLFDKIGGFDEALETDEDYELCMHGRRLGADIINNPDLTVMTIGYPKKLKNFFRRERWHSRSDFATFGKIRKSMPAMLALFHFVSLIMAVALAVAFRDPRWLLALAAGYLMLWMVFAYKRTRTFGLPFLVAIPMYAVYFTARVFSFFDMRFKRPPVIRSAEPGKLYGD
jgi:glycosyltransferase involved in cell wall biosynthesis